MGKSCADLRSIAQGILKGSIFPHWDVADETLVPQLFLALGLQIATGEDMSWLRGAGLIFGRMAARSPRMLHGYPVFFKYEWLTIEDAEIVAKDLKESQRLSEEAEGTDGAEEPVKPI